MSRELALLKKESTEWPRRSLELQTELEAIDDCLSMDEQRTAAKNDLNGRMLLYVGGRSNQVPQLKRLAEDCGAGFLHHDGGLEDNSNARVLCHYPKIGLSTLLFDDGELRVPKIDAAPGSGVAVEINASDVSISLSRPMDVSITNRLPQLQRTRTAG